MSELQEWCGEKQTGVINAAMTVLGNALLEKRWHLFSGRAVETPASPRLQMALCDFGNPGCERAGLDTIGRALG